MITSTDGSMQEGEHNGVHLFRNLGKKPGMSVPFILSTNATKLVYWLFLETQEARSPVSETKETAFSSTCIICGKHCHSELWNSAASSQRKIRTFVEVRSGVSC